MRFLSVSPSILSFPNLFFPSWTSMSAPSTKTLAEYAKSGRASCRKCSETIAKGALRLGLVVRDPRGYDSTKWHHSTCFAFAADSNASSQDIIGFDSLKTYAIKVAYRVVVPLFRYSLACLRFQDSDKEALKKLVDAAHTTPNEAIKEDGDEENKATARDTKKAKVIKAEGDEENKSTERASKKAKLSDFKGEDHAIAFSISNVKDKYKDAILSPNWKAFETVIFLEREDGLNDSTKIAAFDFDGCLANTSVHRVGPDEWSLMYKSIPSKLQSLYSDGYKLVIFTNEANIERWKNKRQVAVDSKIGRLNNFIKEVNLPIQVFIACGISKSGVQAEDRYRKPKPGMWYLMERHFNSGMHVDMDKSFYVGDAAGRDNDHSDADIKFAQAIGLKFHVPEDYFGEPQTRKRKRKFLS